MEYFMSHILYIVIAAVVIAVVAFVTVVLAEKNQANRDEIQEKSGCDCGSSCNGCSSFSFCTKPEKESGTNANKM